MPAMPSAVRASVMRPDPEGEGLTTLGLSSTVEPGAFLAEAARRAELLAALHDRGIPMLHGMRVSVEVDGLMHDGAAFVGGDGVFLKGNPNRTMSGRDPQVGKEKNDTAGGRGFGLRR